MRYAIVSDIHANSQAWKAVLADCRAERVDRILCLGDMIGYGPDPNEVLDSVFDSIEAAILGNHDAAAIGMIDADVFNNSARRALDRTRSILHKRHTLILNTLPFTLQGKDFRCTHGDFAHPEEFNYIFNAADAHLNWSACLEQLLFVGHTHTPCIFVIGESRSTYQIPAQDFVLEAGKRYIVNPGSVGFPRNADLRASYCIYDDETRSVLFRRVPFDLEVFRNAVVAAGMQPADFWFLAETGAETPGAAALALSGAVRNIRVPKTRIINLDIKRAQNRIRFRRRIVSGLLLGLLAVSAFAAGMLLFNVNELPESTITQPEEPLAYIHLPYGATLNVLQPFPVEWKRENGWKLRRTNPREQGVTIAGDTLVFANKAPDGFIELESAPIQISDVKVAKIKVVASAEFDAPSAGAFSFRLEQLCQNEHLRFTVVKTEEKSAPPSHKEAVKIQKTFTKPLKRTTHVRLVLRISAQGYTRVQLPSLIPEFTTDN